MKSFKVIGVMSGSSLDGLDIAACEFMSENSHWRYRIDYADTIAYPVNIGGRLTNAIHNSEKEVDDLDLDYGSWIGERINDFCEKHNYSPDFISSHGHTVFHQPEIRKTVQIGSGEKIQEETGLPVINDFRSMDVAKGGQGAPLVPIGDEKLFSSYTFCLNLGGIANISLNENGRRVAYDICPANMGLNYLASTVGLSYDHNGDLARSGTSIENVLERLNALEYYHNPPPKSLGYEWFEKNIIPILNEKEHSTNDLLHTFVHHVAQQIKRHILNHSNIQKSKKLLITGGGAFNQFLIEQLGELLPQDIQIIIPSEQIISYKEALIFAFLGVLRLRNEVNCLSSVTGADSDSSSGTIYGLIG